MQTPSDAKAKAASTYNSASDHYDDDANSFWERFGRRTIERLALRRGTRVLDVCCGSGTIDVLDTSDREQVKQRAFAFIRESGIGEVETNVIYAVAVKQTV